MATALILILIAVVLTRLPFDGGKAVGAYIEEELGFLSYLTSDVETGYADIETGDLGTTIEEYLL